MGVKGLFSGITGGLVMFVESVRMSVSNILKNRLRSFLTILGIMIGVTAVIALVTTISGVSNSISDSFTSMGAGTLTLSVPGSDLKAGLSAADMNTLSEMEGIQGVTPSVSRSATVSRAGTFEENISISGKNDFYFRHTPDAVVRGRAINRIDIDQQSRVCLLSEEMVETFFYGVDPVGATIYIDNLTFTVVGLLGEDSDESIASIFSGGSDIMIPYTTALKMNGASFVTSLTVYMEEGATTDAVSSMLEPHLDALFSYEDDTYTITTLESVEDIMDEMMSMMSMLLGGIASIALLVGGIGIMNMMLTSVTERTVEIGLKKAIGARPAQIQMQFLIESFLLSMVGGVAGVVLGIGVSAALCSVIGIGFVISYGAVAVGVGFSAAVGILFGWSPARKASALKPIDALRRM